MVTNWSVIPSLRLDKYLYLVRVMISHSFVYLAKLSWPEDLLNAWTGVIMGQGECHGVLDAKDGKVGDGLRYHVLDVWIDGLMEEESWEVGVENGVMKSVEVVSTAGATKTLRDRAKLVVSDERLHAPGGEEAASATAGSEHEFTGFD